MKTKTGDMCNEHNEILCKNQHVKKSDGKISDEYYENKPKIKHTTKSFKVSASIDFDNEKRPKKKWIKLLYLV